MAGLVISSAAKARDVEIEGMYSCEILFNDWTYVDDMMQDKDIHVLFCKEVFPDGPKDKRLRHIELPTKDDMDYHSPVVRLIFKTPLKTLHDNTYRTLGIDYRQRKWYTFSYKDFIDAKKKDIRRVTWLYRFKRHLIEESKKSNKPELFDIINDKLWWKGRSSTLKAEDQLNDIFGVKLNPLNDSSARNISKFKKI